MSNNNNDAFADRCIDDAIDKVDNMAMSAVKRNLIMRGAFKIWMDKDDMHNALVDILANDMFTRNV